MSECYREIKIYGHPRTAPIKIIGKTIRRFLIIYESSSNIQLTKPYPSQSDTATLIHFALATASK